MMSIEKLSSNALLEKFNEKFDNLDDTIYLTNSSNKYVGTIEQIIIPEIGDIEIIRDSTIELSFKNLQEVNINFIGMKILDQ